MTNGVAFLRQTAAFVTIAVAATAPAVSQRYIRTPSSFSKSLSLAQPVGVETLLVHSSPATGKRTPVFRRLGSLAVAYFSGMTIDADGAPNAYHPEDDPGLDSLDHAGRNGNWWALVLDDHGKPIVQQSGKFEGYYVSMTWLSREDNRYPATDPHYWVDARTVPYIAVPKSVWEPARVERGDLAYVVNQKTGKSSVAIVADWGTEDTLGEGSIALAEALGFESSDPRTGGQDDGVVYIVFPGTANKPRWPRKLMEMRVRAQDLFQEWGGWDSINEIRSVRLD